jgi:hypothetical protein
MKFTFGRFAASTLFLAAGMLVFTDNASLDQPDNMGSEETHLRGAAEEGRNLDDRAERLRRRIEVTDQIAASLCEERISLTKALESITAVTQAFPYWFEQLRAAFLSSRQNCLNDEMCVQLQIAAAHD